MYFIRMLILLPGSSVTTTKVLYCTRVLRICGSFRLPGLCTLFPAQAGVWVLTHHQLQGATEILTWAIEFNAVS